MNQLLNISEQKATLTMSSREIASLINKNHSDLCRSIERLIAKGVIKGYQPMAYTHPQEHGHNYTQTRVTSKGIEYIASRYASELML
ncbi:hypothetical protein C2802_06115 [Pasteurella multocida]|nr:Rha family transcriptional regulator [Pasteurella multocida]NNI05467.1 hypothetical protein [Pasteurella multocida]